MHYVLPKKKEQQALEVGLESDEDWDRRVQIPVSAEILEECRVGDSCHVTLVGKVIETKNIDSHHHQDTTLTLSVTEVDASNDEEQYAHNSFAGAFQRRSKHY